MKDDFTTPIEWWPLKAFQGRVNRVSGIDGENEVHITDISIPDHEVVCDLCNDEIKEFPCAVVATNATCPKCLKGMAIEPGDEEYFESPGYHAGEEPPKPRVNHGGRMRRPKKVPLQSAEERNLEAPSTFQIPMVLLRKNLKLKWLVKLIFETGLKRPNPEAERMWVEVSEIRPDGTYVGILKNKPAFMDNLFWGDRIIFSPEHIADIDDEPISS